MNTSIAPSSARPRIVTKITRADMALVIPRLDDKCLDANGNQDREAKVRLDVAIARCAHIYDLGGKVRGAKHVKGKGDQDGIQFMGEFKSHLSNDFGGLWFAAGRCHVPRMFEEVLFQQLTAAQEQDSAATVEFLIRVGARPPKSDKASITGYEWTVEPLVDADVSESAVDILFQKAVGQKALAGPVAAEGG